MTHEQIEKLWEAAQAEWANACGGPMEYQIFGRMVAEEAVRMERLDIVECFEKVARETQDQSPHGKAFWCRAAAESIRTRTAASSRVAQQKEME